MMRWMLMVALMGLSVCRSSAQTYLEWAERGLDYAGRDSLPQAEACLKEALRTDPSNVKNALLLSNLGTVQRRQGKREEALESYSLALNITPYSKTILLNHASLCLDMQLTDKAYSDYCTLLDLDARCVEALQYRAFIYMQRHQYGEARVDYVRLLEAEPTHRNARLGKALADQYLHHYREALEELTRLTVETPRDAMLWKVRANIEMEMGETGQALLDLEEAARLTPGDADIYVTCGQIYLAQGKRRDAYAAFEKAIAAGYPRASLRDLMKQSRR